MRRIIFIFILLVVSGFELIGQSNSAPSTVSSAPENSLSQEDNIINSNSVATFSNQSKCGFTGNIFDNVSINPFNGNLIYQYPISSQTIDGESINVSLTYAGNISNTLSYLTLRDYISGSVFDPKFLFQIYETKQKIVIPGWIIGVNGLAIQMPDAPNGKAIAKALRHGLEKPQQLLQNDDLKIDGYSYCNRISFPDRTEENNYPDQDIIEILRADGTVLQLKNPTLKPNSNDYTFSKGEWYTGTYYDETPSSPIFAKVEFDDTYWTEYYQSQIPYFVHPDSIDKYPNVVKTLPINQPDVIKSKFNPLPNTVSNYPNLFRPRIVKLYLGDGLEYMYREIPCANEDIFYTILYLEKISNSNGELMNFKRKWHNDPSQLCFDRGKGRAPITEFNGHTLTYGDCISIEALGRTVRLFNDESKKRYVIYDSEGEKRIKFDYGLSKDKDDLDFLSYKQITNIFGNTKIYVYPRIFHIYDEVTNREISIFWHENTHSSNDPSKIEYYVIDPIISYWYRFHYCNSISLVDFYKPSYASILNPKEINMVEKVIYTENSIDYRKEYEYHHYLESSDTSKPDYRTTITTYHQGYISTYLPSKEIYYYQNITYDHFQKTCADNCRSYYFDASNNRTYSILNKFVQTRLIDQVKTMGNRKDSVHYIYPAINVDGDLNRFYSNLPVGTIEISSISDVVNKPIIKQMVYTFSSNRDYGNSVCNQLFGRDVSKVETTLFDQDQQPYIKYEETYKHFPLSESDVKDNGIDNFFQWKRFSNEQHNDHYRNRKLQFNANDWQIMPYNKGTKLVIPPKFSIPESSKIFDPNGLVLAGSQNSITDNSVFQQSLTTNQGFNGINKNGISWKSEQIGRGEVRFKKESELYYSVNDIQRFLHWPAKNNFLTEIKNALGSRVQFEYPKNYPTNQPNPKGNMLFGNNSINEYSINQPMGNSEKPFIVRRFNKRWEVADGSPVLKEYSLDKIIERNYWGSSFDAISGFVDENGWYTKCLYDGIGTIKKLWRPGDFPSKKSVATQKVIKLYGETERIEKISSNSTTEKTEFSRYLEIGNSSKNVDNVSYESKSTVSFLLNSYGHKAESAILRLAIQQAQGDCILLELTVPGNNTVNQKISVNCIEGEILATSDDTNIKPQFYTEDPALLGRENKVNFYTDIVLDKAIVDMLNAGSRVGIKISTNTQTILNDQGDQFNSVILGNDADESRAELVLIGSYETDYNFGPNDNYEFSLYKSNYQHNNPEFKALSRIISRVGKSKTVNPLEEEVEIYNTILQEINSQGHIVNTYIPKDDNQSTQLARDWYHSSAKYTYCDMLGRKEDCYGNIVNIEYGKIGEISRIDYPKDLPAPPADYDHAYGETLFGTIENENNDQIIKVIAENTTINHVKTPILIPMEGQTFFNDYVLVKLFKNEDERLNEDGSVNVNERVISVEVYDYFNNLRIKALYSNNSFISTTRYDYDLLGKVKKVINPKNQAITYKYDEFGNNIRVDHPDFGMRKYAYDDLNQLRFSMNDDQFQNAKISFYEYDDLGRVIATGEAKLNKIDVRELDIHIDPNAMHNGQTDGPTTNKTLILEPVRPIPSFNADNSVMSFNCEKNKQIMFDKCPNDASAMIAHATNSITDNELPTSTMNDFENFQQYPENLLVAYFYDSEPTSNGTAWKHIPDLQRIRSLLPKSELRNLKGKVSAIAYRGEHNQPFNYTFYSYDERGRIEGIVHYTENLGLDAVQYQYNSLDKITRIKVVDNFNKHYTWYDYDNKGRVSKVYTRLVPFSAPQNTEPPYSSQYPVAAVELNYLNPIWNYQPIIPDMIFEYDGNNQLIKTTYPQTNPTVSTENSYTRRGWLKKTATTSDSKNYFTEDIAFSKAGLINSISIHRDGKKELYQKFKYNLQDMLTYWDYSERWTDANNIEQSLSMMNQSYTYDAIGNRLSIIGNRFGVTANIGGQYLYGAGTNRLTQAEYNTGTKQVAYSYNNNGALASRTTNESLTESTKFCRENFEYYSSGLLGKYSNTTYCWTAPHACSTDVATTEWRYRYSPAGERYQKRQTRGYEPKSETPFAWVYYMLGADNRQLALYNGLETVCGGEFVYFRPDEYITYGAKGLSDIRTKSQGEKEISVFDHLGSVRCSMKQDGTLIGYRDYEPFGAPLSAKQEKTRLGYIDKEQDKESSLADHGVRKYDYETGRFISCDLLWQKSKKWSPYQYALNNPISYLDNNGNDVINQKVSHEQVRQLNAAINEINSWGSPTASNLVNRAYSEGTCIYLNFFSSDRPVSGSTPSNVGANRTLEQSWNQDRFSNLEQPSGITKCGESEYNADIILDEDKFEENSSDSDEELWQGLNGIVFIDELEHSLSNNYGNPDKSRLDHKELYDNLCNELLEGRLNVSPLIKGVIEDRYMDFH